MQQSSRFFTAMLAGLAIFVTGSTVDAGVVAIPALGPTRIAGADAVIVGKVESLEAQEVKVENTTYRVAVVKIDQGVKGTKDAKTLRIAFIPVDKGKKIIIPGLRAIQLQVGQEGLFLLKKHAKEDFYTINGPAGYYFGNDSKDFAREVQTAKASVKVVENPRAALKSKDADERYLAAAVLIGEYRSHRGPNFKQEAIDAEESKLIMQVLAESDWQSTSDYRSLRPTPAQLFQRLGVTAQDGLVVPAGANSAAITQVWVQGNAQTYRIQKIVDAK